MIEQMAVTEWRSKMGWKANSTAEQDLILSRALVELFQLPLIKDSFSLRGGAALNKLVFQPALRYSEDIDLVQEKQGVIGPAIDIIRKTIDSWLGKPRVETTQRGTTIVWRFQTSDQPPLPMRLKVEINTREHAWIGTPIHTLFVVENAWYKGKTEITTLKLEDLLATKLRALYQRRKGRDLYDLWMAKLRFHDLDINRTVKGFLSVMGKEGRSMDWATFEKNILQKLNHPSFGGDIQPLITEGSFDAAAAWAEISPWLKEAFSHQ